jgi:hypothetical protein
MVRAQEGSLRKYPDSQGYILTAGAKVRGMGQGIVAGVAHVVRIFLALFDHYYSIRPLGKHSPGHYLYAASGLYRVPGGIAGGAGSYKTQRAGEVAFSTGIAVNRYSVVGGKVSVGQHVLGQNPAAALSHFDRFDCLCLWG